MSSKPEVDLKKVRAAAAGRAKKPTRNWKVPYYISVGGSLALIIGAVAMMVLSPDRGPFQMPVNEGHLITHVNRNSKTWKAGASSFFEGWTIGDVKMLEGVSVSQMGGAVANCVIPDTPVPESFDARLKWPQCFNSPIYNMGNCTASWAIATASALSNRFCISSPSEYSELMLSPQQLLSCDTMNRACNGGDIDTAWNYIAREGLVSEICFPYQADGSVSCESRCTTEKPLKSAAHCMLNNELAIRREIFLNGPVVAPLFLMDDFLVYRGGVYREMPTATQLSDAKRQRIIHAVKIIGWGFEGGKLYWLIENSWGEDWGEQGFAKVSADTGGEKKEGVIIETYVLAGTPANKKVDSDSDADADFENDIDLEDVDVDTDFDDDAEKSAGDDEENM